jgi:hypothetical protein
MVDGEAGKGDDPRPVNKKQYDRHFDNIKTPCSKCGADRILGQPCMKCIEQEGEHDQNKTTVCQEPTEEVCLLQSVEGHQNIH